MTPVTELTNLFRCLDEYIKTWPFHFFQTPFGHFKIWPLAALTSHQLADSYPKRTKCFPWWTSSGWKWPRKILADQILWREKVSDKNHIVHTCSVSVWLMIFPMFRFKVRYWRWERASYENHNAHTCSVSVWLVRPGIMWYHLMWFWEQQPDLRWDIGGEKRHLMKTTLFTPAQCQRCGL